MVASGGLSVRLSPGFAQPRQYRVKVGDNMKITIARTRTLPIWGFMSTISWKRLICFLSSSVEILTVAYSRFSHVSLMTLLGQKGQQLEDSMCGSNQMKISSTITLMH